MTVKLTHPDGAEVETTEDYAAMYESQGFERAKSRRKKADEQSDEG